MTRVFVVGISLTIAIGAAAANCAAYFNTLPPHASLPSDSTCASQIAVTPEVRPGNAPYNSQAAIPPAWQLTGAHTSPLYGAAVPPASDFARVDGNYYGSTDMILRWAACKWGIDENVVRAEAVLESHWHQTDKNDWRTVKADCERGNWYAWTGTGCDQTYGILMIKLYNFNASPEAVNSTAFNADFRMAFQRACMNGDLTYLSKDQPVSGYPVYPKGDSDQMMWGCMGDWFSGQWYNAASIGYIGRLQAVIAAPPWPSW
jgi:hypothetical protein